MRACLWLLFGFLTLTIPMHSLAQGADARERACKGLFKKKKLIEAAQCFAELAKTLDAKALKKASLRYQKGRWVRNAAILMTKAARVEKDAAKKSYYYERAKGYAALYLKEKLYETKHQQRLGKVRVAGLEAKIGYTFLSITTKHLKAKIQLEGYKFKASGVGAWSQKVRPGNYVARVTYPKSPVEIKAIKVVSGTPKIVAFVPPASALVAARPNPPVKRQVDTRGVARATPRVVPKPPASSPVWPWALVIGGGAVAVAGAVITGFGGTNYNAAVAMRERGLKGEAGPNDKVEAFNGLHDQAGWQLPLGISLLSAGVVAVVVGGLGKAMAKKPAKSAALPPTSTHKRALLYFAK